MITGLLGDCKAGGVSVGCCPRPLVPSPGGVSGLLCPEDFRSCLTQGPAFQERHLLWSLLVSPDCLWKTSEEADLPSVYWSVAMRITKAGARVTF